MIVRLCRLAVLAAAVCLAPVVPTMQSTAGGFTVEVVDMSFTPSKLTIPLGNAVTWNFQDATTHTSTSDQGFWNSGSKSEGGTFAYTFTAAGSYAYHCMFHS